jgi:effector-binding domain-containing protein
MNLEPQIQQRAEQPYAGIRTVVTMDSLPAAVDATFPELFAWLQANGSTPAGPPFIRYHVIDMKSELDIEFGIPVNGTVPGDTRVRAGALPAGRYATLRHIGSYDGLAASNAELQRWAEQHGVALDMSETGRGEVWRGRVEHYLTDPSAEPDPAKWETDVAYLIREPEQA